MKLPTVLYMLLVFFNLLSLGFIIGFFILNGIEDSMRNEHARLTVYGLYITVLLNLYGLFYIAIKNRFAD